jgi:hypothetical protein
MTRADHDPDDDGHVFPDEDYHPTSPVADEPGPPAQPSQVRTAVIAVVATIVVIAVGWFSWQKYSEYKDAEKKEQLSSWVETSTHRKLDEDPKFSTYGIRVTSVDLIKVSDNKYEGIAQVTTARSSEPHQVPIDVTADGGQMMWQAEPGAFLFLAQEALQNCQTTG